MAYDGDGGVTFGADGNKEQNNGCLQNIETNDLFDIIIFHYDGVKTDTHQQNVQPVIDL